MSSLALGFIARMLKRVASSQWETTPGFEVPGGKHSKQSGLDGEAQNRTAIIIVDSPKRASNGLLTLKGAA